MTSTHRLFSRQLAKATKAAGEVDLDRLGALVAAAYEQSDRDRRRTDRSISLMIEELDTLNRRLELLVEERTAALQAREEELRGQNMLFDAALNNMSQALLMFDGAGRLVIWNNRYMEMYRLQPGQVKRGDTLLDLVRARQAVGTFGGDPEEYVESVMAAVGRGVDTDRVAELPDGRTIAVLNAPMPGGGWVATHEDITERCNAEKRIVHMARHDALTDLPNRLLFHERLAVALDGIHRGERLAVLYLDLNNFKSVNDTLGHQTGDQLLKAVAGRLSESVRAPDTVARVGGGEFAIVQTGVEQPIDTEILARRICAAIRAPYNVNGQMVTIDTSVGIAMAPGDGNEPNDLLKNAGIALYGAKADGGGTYRFFEPAMDARMKARRSLELSLRQALAAGEFELHYQPVVRLEDNTIAGCEALVRWRHPERGMIPPSEFIPVAEEIGLIVPLGEWVLRTACAAAVAWPDDVRIAVNLSPIQVMNPNLVGTVMGALAAAGLPARRLELEITESVMMQNTDATLISLHRLRQLGVRISMDDFGTGYSSLSYLRRFPFDKIKIDRCFIRDLPEDADAVAIVRAVAGLAKNLGMVTTAEGIETEEQLAQVRALGCDEMQGFLFSPPRRARDIAELFAALLPKQAMIA